MWIPGGRLFSAEEKARTHGLSWERFRDLKYREGSGCIMIILPHRAASRILGSKHGNPG